ncbi:T9SS type A sorting domain-containing protein, partial [Pseudopedobacter sp.]|uniref:T9SS type A sorting domain-containing protein n=1 Tax=Pseudopedobacter sp. TaxID=1936787 RepID=UPI00333F223E
LSPNGMYLAVGGYAKNVGESRTIALNGTGDLAKVQIYGSTGVNTVLKSYTLPAGIFSYGNSTVAGNVTNSRFTGTVALNDGTGLYAGGGSTNTTYGGTFYINNNATTGNADVFNQIQTTQSNLRVPGIFNGQLYTSANAAALGDAAAIRLGIFSEPFPTEANSATISNLPGADFSIPIASGGVPINICQFVFYDADASIAGADVVFVTDDGSTAGHKGGIKKYVKNASGNWELKYEVYTGSGVNDVNNYKFRGLVGQINSQNNVTLYATAYDPQANLSKVLKLTDTDIYTSITTPAITTLITAPSSNYIFKGISFTPGSTLPLKLTSFDVSRKLSEILLSWTTESEFNTKEFEVQRSADGSNFETVRIIETVNKPGKNSYSVIDKAVSAEAIYYRLKMVDLDGTFSYSDVKAVRGLESVFDIYPNPVKTKLTIKHGKVLEPQRFQVVDINGKTALTIHVSLNTTYTEVDLSSLKKGVYVIQSEIHGQRVERKIIKE